MKNEILLGVNIDHVATIRQARGTRYPDPIQAAIAAEEAGADGITLHLREDLRHIQVRDVKYLKEMLQTRMNLEIAITAEMLNFAKEIKPEYICLVPEKREELTTEGGLDLINNFSRIDYAVKSLQENGSAVSLFIDPEPAQIEKAAATGTQVIEIHTGRYADAITLTARNKELQRIKKMTQFAASFNLCVNAGHGLNYHNVKPIAAIKELYELNIGHAIVARALFSGFQEAVITMRALMQKARNG